MHIGKMAMKIEICPILDRQIGILKDRQLPDF